MVAVVVAAAAAGQELDVALAVDAANPEAYFDEMRCLAAAANPVTDLQAAVVAAAVAVVGAVAVAVAAVVASPEASQFAGASSESSGPGASEAEDHES